MSETHVMGTSPDMDERGEAQFYLDLLRTMILIRRFEDTCHLMYMQGMVHGTTHLYSGQEAVSVGLASLLKPADRVAATYRGHGISLALGISPDSLLAELYGRSSGTCGGRAGSMNVIDLDHQLVGCFGIVGGSIAAATGAGLALKLQRQGGVALAFFGDGSTNHGYFHECLNFAKVNALPCLFVCENNLYGEFTPWEDVTAGEIIARPEAMGIPSRGVDGNDVWAVREVGDWALNLIRNGHGPAFIEARTYRYVGHSRSDPGAYRKPGELEQWQARDPIIVASRRLQEQYGVEPGALEMIREHVEQQLEAALQFADSAPFPDPTVVASEFKTD